MRAKLAHHLQLEPETLTTRMGSGLKCELRARLASGRIINDAQCAHGTRGGGNQLRLDEAIIENKTIFIDAHVLESRAKNSNKVSQAKQCTCIRNYS